MDYWSTSILIVTFHEVVLNYVSQLTLQLISASHNINALFPYLRRWSCYEDLMYAKRLLSYDALKIPAMLDISVNHKIIFAKFL